MKKLFALSLLVLLCASIHYSQNDDWKFSGHIQLRSELDGRDFSNKTHPLTFASLRTRVGVEKTLLGKVNFFVQLQDSRIFGEEGGTLTPIDNIDLHQGYIKLNNLFDWEMDIQAGRFEVVYGTERFFGAVGWHYIGRAWDGVRVMFNPGFKLDLFALTHTESISYIGNATPGTYPIPSPERPSYSVYGLWESANLNEQNRLDIFGYYEINRKKLENSDNFSLDRFTLGLNHFGNYGNLSTIFEGAYQFGNINYIDVSAYLFSLQGLYKFNSVIVGIGADIISGNSNESIDNFKSNYFSPSFGTNHKFYGYMDYFINIPNNTFGLGLHDYYLNLSLQPIDCNFSGSLDFHYFTTNKIINLAFVGLINNEGSELNNIENSILGQEIDLTVKYKFVKGTTLTWGGSLFIPGDLMKLIFIGREDIAFWSYLMITANL